MMYLNSRTYLMRLIALLLCILWITAAHHAIAACENSLKLEGTLSVDGCGPADKGCIPASEALYDYSKSAKTDSSALTINMHASPWRLYDADMRILTIEELAETLKPLLKDDVKRVVLVASWSDMVLSSGSKSLAQKLSDSLGGFPVIGMDGFVWMAKDGAVRTTRQAFTAKRSKYPYLVHPGAEVMISLVAGWYIEFEDDFAKKPNAGGVMRAGAGWDIFMLCPDRALQSFEAAANLSDPVAAYNAALTRLERNREGDREAAIELLTQASALGDKKAKVQLEKVTRRGR